MPTKTEREYYAQGFRDGRRSLPEGAFTELERDIDIDFGPRLTTRGSRQRKTKRKLSPWNKYVKANSKKPRFRMRSGKLNLKKMAVAFRKTPAGRKRKK
jgi:hypothetical protein